MVWQKCRGHLESELNNRDFSVWIQPLQAVEEGSQLRLLAPNRYVMEQVDRLYIDRITELVQHLGPYNGSAQVRLEIGSVSEAIRVPSPSQQESPHSTADYRAKSTQLNPSFTFATFVEGKSNEMAKAAALQAAMRTGVSYNPLLLYGEVGLGKTHLMQAVGNYLLEQDQSKTVVYLHSRDFVQDMVRALKEGTMMEFMRYYRSIDVLLIDDIQFFANKIRSQEEFFHVFNTLHEAQHQLVLTCDRYPKHIEGLEERLTSRVLWGMPMVVEPPELEHRVAILMKKAEAEGICLPDEAAFFIAERIRSNVRELEGALRRVIAHSRHNDTSLSIEQVKLALRDLLKTAHHQVNIESIQREVASYYKIRVADLYSKRRNRTIVRPRQIAMALAKELTSRSLPEIGDAFGGRDHTTVLHACRKMSELRAEHAEIETDYKNLVRLLTA